MTKPTIKKQDPERRMTSMRIRPDVWAKIRAAAIMEGLSSAEFIEKVCTEYIERKGKR